MATSVNDSSLSNLPPPQWWWVGLVLTLFLTAVGAQWFAGIHEARIYVGLLTTGGVVYATQQWRSLIASLRPFALIHPATGWAIAWLIPLLGLNWLLHRQAHAPQSVDIWAMVFLFAVLPAVLEELAFRGVLQPVLESVWGPVAAVAGTAVLFALAHPGGAAEDLIYLLAVGMLLGWVRWRTGSLWSAVVVHLIHNLGAIGLFALGG
jgi:membrane protease YdiL (CAAX protease family)